MRPAYRAQPIGSLGSLALALGMSESALKALATSASNCYTTFEIPRKDGRVRQVSDPSHELKVAQKRINRQIFSHVEYPPYLFGGLPERDYVRNAKTHAAAASLIALDVEDFYDSIRADHVLKIFKIFCRFPEPVARVLTQLTTKDGAVAQGACTSSHLANLVFFDTEHRIVREFHQQGLRYSRLLDDITISSAHRELTPGRTSKIIHKITILLADKHLKLKVKKTRVTTRSNPEALMEVTGLWLNRGQPRVFRNERHEIRAQLHALERRYQLSNSSSDYHTEHNQLSGRISKISYVGHFESGSYRARLQKILPTYDGTEVVRTLRLVKLLCATPVAQRDTVAYVDKYHQVLYRLGIVARTNRTLATKQRALVLKCAPAQTKEELLYG